MELHEAQREVRSVFIGGAVGQFVTGGIWLASAALSTWGSRTLGILALVVGGMFIFPLTQLILRLLGRPATLKRENPLGRFSLQTVAAMFATFPLIYFAARADLNWFYPAFMIVIGAHYVMFIHLYGMWQYGLLAAVLAGAGLVLAAVKPVPFSLGGWLAGAVLVVFASAVLAGAPGKNPGPAR
jgi:hypothetical protein